MPLKNIGGTREFSTSYSLELSINRGHLGEKDTVQQAKPQTQMSAGRNVGALSDRVRLVSKTWVRISRPSQWNGTFPFKYIQQPLQQPLATVLPSAAKSHELIQYQPLFGSLSRFSPVFPCYTHSLCCFFFFFFIPNVFLRPSNSIFTIKRVWIYIWHVLFIIFNSYGFGFLKKCICLDQDFLEYMFQG